MSIGIAGSNPKFMTPYEARSRGPQERPKVAHIARLERTRASLHLKPENARSQPKAWSNMVINLSVQSWALEVFTFSCGPGQALYPGRATDLVCSIAWHGEPRGESGHIEGRCQIWRTDIAVAITVDRFPRPT